MPDKKYYSNGKIYTVPVTQSMSFADIIKGNRPNKLTKAELIELGEIGWQAICNHKNASVLSTIPLKLYMNKGTSKIITQHKAIKKDTDIRLKSLQINKALKEQDEIVEILDHPYIDLLWNVNPRMNYVDFASFLSLYLGSIGYAYAEVIREGKKIVELQPLLAEYVTPYADSNFDGQIQYYKYELPDKPIRIIDKDSVMAFNNWTCGSKMLGKGDLDQCLYYALQMKYYSEYEQYINLNNGRPDFMLGYKGRATKEDQLEITKKFYDRFNGIENSGRPIITFGQEYSIEKLGFAPKDMAHEQGIEVCKKTICAAYGVPIDLIDTTNSNRATASEGSNSYFRYTIYPKLSKFCEQINTFLFGENSNLYFWFDQSEMVDKKTQTEQTMKQFELGIIDLNECRNLLGYDDTTEILTTTTTTMANKPEDVV